MVTVKSLRIGLCVIGGWAIAPTAWANALEATAEASLQPEQTPAAEQTSAERSPATTVDGWMAQIEAARVQITGVRLNETETGLQIVLETAEGTLATPTTIVTGNVLTADIPNAVLVLPKGEAFEAANPVVGIDQISVTSVSGDQVRVTVSATDAPPVAEVQATGKGLVFAVTPGTADVADTEDAEVDITVTADRPQEGYTVPDATTATRTDTPLRDVPQSIQVVPREVLEDQQVIRLDEALRNVSGVSQNSADPRGQRFQVRGFDSSNLLRDGFSQNFGGSFGNSGFQDLSNIERVEVLKGPAAILYGTSQPGGIINLVTKKPLSEPYYGLELSVGNRGLIEPSIDLSGTLTEATVYT